MEIVDHYRLDLPYPAVTITECDYKYANMLSDVYAGQVSKTTAIAQYRVHALYLPGYPHVLAAYRGIGEVEMLHQDLLGSLVMKLCASPRLFSGVSRRFWNGSFPAYQCRLLPIFNSDIKGEREIIAVYRRCIECVRNESINALLERIMLDEELHITILQSLIDRYGNP
ncbi:MAG: hypothetical protein EOM66_02145 [Clostridia bacterium]|nr:hypothetical protein [Candidatus Pelethousia sp.]NCB30190.1 hypothetical protein [Clostridia bacterium]